MLPIPAGNPFHQRRFARPAQGDIAHADHGHAYAISRRRAAIIAPIAPQHGHRIRRFGQTERPRNSAAAAPRRRPLTISRNVEPLIKSISHKMRRITERKKLRTLFYSLFILFPNGKYSINVNFKIIRIPFLHEFYTKSCPFKVTGNLFFGEQCKVYFGFYSQ